MSFDIDSIISGLILAAAFFLVAAALNPFYKPISPLQEKQRIKNEIESLQEERSSLSSQLQKYNIEIKEERAGYDHIGEFFDKSGFWCELWLSNGEYVKGVDGGFFFSDDDEICKLLAKNNALKKAIKKKYWVRL